MHGTSDRSGTATILAAETGSRTEFAGIAAAIERRVPETDFSKGIRRFGYLMAEVMLPLEPSASRELSRSRRSPLAQISVNNRRNIVSRRILVIVGHPDPDPKRLCRALTDAYIVTAEDANGRVMANDNSATILALAMRNSRRAGHGNVNTHLADAEQLNLSDDAFDAAVCRLGLMFLSDPLAGLGQIYRTLRPGGRFCRLHAPVTKL